MNILILAAGETTTDRDEPSYPTWLAEVEGGLLLERQVDAFRKLNAAQYVFMFRHSDIETYYLASIVEQMVPNSIVLPVRRDTAGAACTALLAAGVIEMDQELIVASATDQIDVDYGNVLARFRDRGADAGVLTFKSLHPRYSYVRVDDEGWVIESSEKRPISRIASTGLYWFARAADFFDASREMILKDAHVQGRFYVCPALNELVLRQKKIATYSLEIEQYHPLKSDKQVGQFEHLLEERLGR